MPSNDKEPDGFYRDSKDPFLPKDKGVKTMKVREEEFMIGPHGEKRPADPIANAVRAMEIATGLAEEEYVTEEDIKKRRGD